MESVDKFRTKKESSKLLESEKNIPRKRNTELDSTDKNGEDPAENYLRASDKDQSQSKRRNDIVEDETLERRLSELKKENKEIMDDLENKEKDKTRFGQKKKTTKKEEEPEKKEQVKTWFGQKIKTTKKEEEPEKKEEDKTWFGQKKKTTKEEEPEKKISSKNNNSSNINPDDERIPREKEKKNEDSWMPYKKPTKSKEKKNSNDQDVPRFKRDKSPNRVNDKNDSPSWKKGTKANKL